ncbi:hypothetical protein Pmar_PMAR021815 [Perkinsus marinus ATCC 50983]|uniref:SET domain-containing protein n=1 Tax=Perkinsus marinus (strain ATCC 50983 / TXsc) TaxID=423536 RepID=C5LG54_PERM5|nr:hypothetical protein Pmar_PMAR021815 [Perkinsus marinus ATCC 50983]EER04309.1 hypothetical protein Pmar_PMAR021815 [Perkinsus marinus ATCC 50983]|eukprot:XP_002772493.1 hypothetical protein Pmar_PMAR021815 [Perkinsus marinus ATCC 50983]
MPKKKSRSSSCNGAAEVPRGFEELLPAVPGNTKSTLRPQLLRVAKCFEVRHSEVSGMGLYASDDIPEGCILLEEQPAVIIAPRRECAVAGTLDNLLWIMKNFSDARKLRQFLYPRSSGDLEALPDGIKDDINSFAHFFSHEQSAKWLARPEAWKAVMNVFDDEEESKPCGLAHASGLDVYVCST